MQEAKVKTHFTNMAIYTPVTVVCLKICTAHRSVKKVLEST